MGRKEREARRRLAEQERLRRRQRNLRLGLVGLLACLVIALVLVVRGVLGSGGSDEADDASVQVTAATTEWAPASVAASTPQNEWERGVMPYIFQIDEQYKDIEYSGGTLEKQGCGPCALLMAYVYLTGSRDMGVADMVAFSTENGYSTDGNGSAWALISEGSELLGLSCTEIASDPNAIRESLEAGNPVIAVMAPGTFTEVGHFITLERLTEDGMVVVHDSNSVERSLYQTWDAELICSEASAIWSLSVA